MGGLARCFYQQQLAEKWRDLCNQTEMAFFDTTGKYFQCASAWEIGQQGKNKHQFLGRKPTGNPEPHGQVRLFTDGN